MQYQVAQHVQRLGDVLVQHLDVEADGLLAGKGVQVAADRVHLARNVLGRAGLGTLEDHVFHKMRDAIQLCDFMPRAGAYPHAHSHGANMLHALRQDCQPVRQDGPLHTAFVRHRCLRELLRIPRSFLRGRGRAAGLLRSPERREAECYAGLDSGVR